MYSADYNRGFRAAGLTSQKQGWYGLIRHSKFYIQNPQG